MRFLQKNNGQPNVDLQLETSRKKHRRDRAQVKEEEISAFFTAVPPPQTETAGNSILAKFDDVPGVAEYGGERSSAINGAISTAEFLDEPSSLKPRTRGS